MTYNLRLISPILFNCVFLILFPLKIFSQDIIQKGEHKVFYYENGNISSEGILVDGKPDRFWKTYYENGTLKSEGERKNFLLHGLWKFYYNSGALELEMFYEKGKKEGFKKKYYKNGFLKFEENYNNDLKDGICKYFYKDTTQNGGSSHLYRKINYEKGKKRGKSFEYSRDGRVTSVLHYKNDFLVKEEKINRIDAGGLRQGVWKEFYRNDQIKQEGKYEIGRASCRERV